MLPARSAAAIRPTTEIERHDDGRPDQAVLQRLPEDRIAQQPLKIRQPDPLAVDRDAVPLVERQPECLHGRPQHEDDVEQQDRQDEEVCNQVPLQHVAAQLETAATGSRPTPSIV